MGVVDLVGSARQVVSQNPSGFPDDRIKIDELAAKYPDGVTITRFGAFTGINGRFFKFMFAEDSTRYFNGGGDLAKMAEAWLDVFSVDEINETLAAEPFRIKVEKVKIKGGKTYTKVQILSNPRAELAETVGADDDEEPPWIKQIDNDTGEVIFR